MLNAEYFKKKDVLRLIIKTLSNTKKQLERKEPMSSTVKLAIVSFLAI